MKKRVSVLLALVILLSCGAGLSGCKGAETTDPTEQASAETSGAARSLEDSLSDEVYTISVARPGMDIKIASIIMAYQMGYYKEEGVNVTFAQISDLATGLTAVSTGSIDVLPFGSIPSCTFVSQGVDVTVFGGTIAEGSEALVLKENADKYADAKDFAGAKIACFRMETGHMVMKGWLREQGVDVEKDVEWIYMDSMASIAQAVQKGEADIGFVNSGYGYVATHGTGLAVGFQVGDYVQNFPCCRETTSRAALEEKHDGFVRFMIANLRGYETIMTDKETTIKALAEYSGQSEEYVENVIYGTDEYDAAMIISLDPCKNSVVDFYKTMIANGDIDAATAYKMDDHVDTEIYETALDILLERNPGNAMWTDLMTQFKANNA